MGSPNVVEALLNAGANVDTQSEYEMTPLLNWTDGWMYPQTLNLLLGAGADVNAKGLGGDTVLHTLLRFKISSAADAEESILTLLRYGANALIPNDEDTTPWDYAQTEQLKGTQAYWALNDARYRQMDD
jgi:ankyrin repeat protein